MTQLKGTIPSSFAPIKNRALSDLPADMAAVTALAQGAVNVEMFTLPLYLCAMSSIHGTHEINSQGNDFYKGRVWPGLATTAGLNLDSNRQAYNTIFSVFIQEMLHLQLAANLAAVLGVKPKFFDDTILENKKNGWSCYGHENTVIPHIIDLKDTKNNSSLKVKLDELNGDQIKLFLAIEQPHSLASENIEPKARDKYFPEVPFQNWTEKNTEADLPMFGTIGWMYYCLVRYLSIEYTDGQNLWEKMFNPAQICVQRDLFNATSSGHQPEYPKMPARITTQDTSAALVQAIDIVKGICDQGEGGIGNILNEVKGHFQGRRSRRSKTEFSDSNYVHLQYQPDNLALQADYPSYDSDGKETGGSDDGFARTSGDAFDHWQRFDSLNKLIAEHDFMTWKKWFHKGHKWEASDLTNEAYEPKTANPNIPKPEEVAAALNELKKEGKKSELSKVVVGAIAGINSVLSESWGNAKVAFPYPSMSGSGDRMSFYWAVFGEAPDLSVGIEKQKETKGPLHACQGMSYDNENKAACAAIEVYHTCRGSNACKAQGGCGFVQSVHGGGGCGSMRVADPTLHSGNLCGAPTPHVCNTPPAPPHVCNTPPVPPHSCGGSAGGKFSAPSDNQCKSFGGCAVPISASQLYPSKGTMDLVNVLSTPSETLGDLPFKVGDSVYDTAWNAYVQVMKANNKTVGEKPEPSPLRKALPPST